MKLKNNFVLKQIAGETVAIYVNKDTADLRRAVSLNGSAKEMFEALQNGASKQEIISLLTENYNISKEQATNDANAFIELLCSNNLLDG